MIFILIVILFIGETNLKEYPGIKTVRSKQKEQAYRLLKNTTEIKNRVFTT